MEDESAWLLSVDTGVVSGMAVFSRHGRLLHYGSHNYGDKNRLKRNIPQLLASWGNIGILLLEGGGRMADIWISSAGGTGIEVVVIQAETWRGLFFASPLTLSASDAKAGAIEKARVIISHCALRKSKELAHHTAEAILSGVFFLHGFGVEFPRQVKALMRF
jgi:hypothetical protein